MKPVLLPPNRFPHFYRGGARITDLRGVPAPSERAHEEWLASTTPRFGAAPAGLTVLPNGRLLRDAVVEDPWGWLGPEHVAAFGADTGLLVKLLDAGERLPVHLHPDRAWARRHLGCRYGKTEAWYVVATDEGARVHLGFREDVAVAELADRVERQDSAGMLDAMHVRAVSAGDGILVPAGWPHAIGGGILLVEAQEPTDFSILLEWTGFDLDGPTEGHLGLGFETALGAVDLRSHTSDEIDALVRPAVTERADALLAVVVVLAGTGELTATDGALQVSRGDVLAVPYDAGDWTLRGAVEAVVCRPSRVAPTDSV